MAENITSITSFAYDGPYMTEDFKREELDFVWSATGVLRHPRILCYDDSGRQWHFICQWKSIKEHMALPDDRPECNKELKRILNVSNFSVDALIHIDMPYLRFARHLHGDNDPKGYNVMKMWVKSMELPESGGKMAAFLKSLKALFSSMEKAVETLGGWFDAGQVLDHANAGGNFVVAITATLPEAECYSSAGQSTLAIVEGLMDGFKMEDFTEYTLWSARPISNDMVW